MFYAHQMFLMQMIISETRWSVNESSRNGKGKVYFTLSWE